MIEFTVYKPLWEAGLPFSAAIIGSLPVIFACAIMILIAYKINKNTDNNNYTNTGDKK